MLQPGLIVSREGALIGAFFDFTSSLILMNRLVSVLLLCLVVLAASHSHSQTLSLMGTVRDAATLEAIPAANVRVLGSTRGTIANAAGEFRLKISTSTSRLVISALGYSPDTIVVHEGIDTIGSVILRPADIILPEVVVTSEDPAIAIIKKAIARKHQWIDRLATFSMDAFTRQVLRKDTSIASITESLTRGYWKAGDTLREVILQRRQTQNIKQEFNFAAVGVILNFNEDRIRFLGHVFVGPTADDALEYYAYKLLRTRAAGMHEVYDIAITPRTRLTPLFSGTISISGENYALAGVDVQPNEALALPFLKEMEIQYRQQFGLYDSVFWMPTDIRINGRFVVGVIGLSLPPIGLEQTSVISSYSLNGVIPDSVFHKSRVVVDSSSSHYDSTLWASSEVLPLTSEERQAYRSLDSSKTLEVQFRPGGFTANFMTGGAATDMLSHLDFTFNRVEGLHLGLQTTVDSLSQLFQIRGRFAYAFAAKKTVWSAGGTVFMDEARTWGIGGDYASRYERTPVWQTSDPIFDGLMALFTKTDVSDYYRAEGWKAFLQFAPSVSFFLKTSYVAERHFPSEKVTDWSILFAGTPFRTNIPAREGRLRSLRLDLRIGREALPIGFITYDAAGISVEHASPSLGGVFSFTQWNAYGSVSIPTFGKDFLFRQQLRICGSAGTTTGTPPPQRYLAVETGAAGTAAFGTMRAMGLKEYRGTSYATVSVEYNFRNLPFLALGIPRSLMHNLELVIHGGAANSWGGTGFPEHPAGWYAEAGFGLSRVMDLFRLDATWRLTLPGDFGLTIGFANLF